MKGRLLVANSMDKVSELDLISCASIACKYMHALILRIRIIVEFSLCVILFLLFYSFFFPLFVQFMNCILIYMLIE
jgi:hypothetical protein